MCACLILSTFSGFKQLLLLNTVIPAAEKTRSAAVDVAGTHNTDLTNLTTLGNLASLIFHNSNIFTCRLGALTCKYISNSSWMVKLSSFSSGPSKISKADFLHLLASGASGVSKLSIVLTIFHLWI